MTIMYGKLFTLMAKKGITKYYLRTHGIHATVVDKLIKGGTVNTNTIAKLCDLLNCQPGDILEFSE
jgi:Predicted transcriptional regulator